MEQDGSASRANRPGPMPILRIYRSFLRRFLQQRRASHLRAVRHSSSGEGEQRQATHRRGRAPSKHIPLWRKEFNADPIGRIATQDLRKGPDIALMIGTSLKVPGARRLVIEYVDLTYSLPRESSDLFAEPALSHGATGVHVKSNVHPPKP